MHLPKYAEHSFARACSRADAIAHRPDDDQNGWDYLVEFAAKNTSSRTDLRAPASKAFVQVKTSATGKLSCVLKLSNALKSAQSKWPWFLVLYCPSKGTAEPSVYVKHFWRDEIERTLRAVRTADVSGAELNQKSITFLFTESDRRQEHDLVPWMEECIDQTIPDYYVAKKTIFDTIGFENGNATGRITFEASDQEQLFENFLGLGNGISASKISMTPWRFGISDLKPEFTLENATVFIRPSVAGQCEIRLRGHTSETITIPATVYVLGEPILSLEKRRYRFSAPGFELVWGEDGYSKVDFTIKDNQPYAMSDLHAIATLFRWTELGPIDLQVWAHGGRAIAGTINVSADPAASRFDWAKVVDILATLRSISNSNQKILISIADVNRSAQDLYFFHQIVTAPSLMIEFQPEGDFPESPKAAVYYVSSDIGLITAYAMIERTFRAVREIEDGRMQIILDRPTIRESWMVKDATDKQRTMMEADYRRYLAAQKETGQIFVELEDIGALHKNSRGLSVE